MLIFDRVVQFAVFFDQKEGFSADGQRESAEPGSDCNFSGKDCAA
jgi:hypothetical protein